jgi:uncharacterized protein YlxW (UPF0749 family)
MKPFVEFFLEYRTSQHNFTSQTLRDAYQQSYKIFIDKGFTTASTFAIWDFIYRILPEKFKPAAVQKMKKKYYGTALRPFVVNLVNSNVKWQEQADELASKMTDKNNIVKYLNKTDHGSRRKGKLNALSQQAGREITKDF